MQPPAVPFLPAQLPAIGVVFYIVQSHTLIPAVEQWQPMVSAILDISLNLVMAMVATIEAEIEATQVKDYTRQWPS